MAKKPLDGCNFKAEANRLKTAPPERLYFIYGPEDYLTQYYLDTLRNTVIPEGDNGFSLKRFDGPEINAIALQSAIDTLPFISERTFVELHNIDLNKLSNADTVIEVLKTIPDYCTVAFIQDFRFEPDKRLKIIKFLTEKGHAVCLTDQEAYALISWIKKRFKAAGKDIDDKACEHLMFTSGTLMNRLIPEIDKLAGYSKGDTVTIEDINAVANRIPEADIFDMINSLSAKNYDAALQKIADLLSNKDNEPIGILAMISYQFRRLYGIKLVLSRGGGYSEVGELLNTNWSKLINENIALARGFKLSELKYALSKCAETDYKMKSTGLDGFNLLKDFVLSLIIEEQHE